MYSLWNLLSYPFSSEEESQSNQKIYNCVRDTHDNRDQYHLFYSVHQLQPTIDLRPKCPAVYDQGELGSCTANAIGGAYEFDEIKQKEGPGEIFIPSRLFIYYNERNKEHNVEHDAGAEIRDGIKSIVKQGVCPESDWPYIISKFTEKPPERCYQIAQEHKAIKYRRVLQLEEQFKRCLTDGFPIVFGMQIFPSFETTEVAQTGQVPMPQENEKPLGGHAVLCVGYDDAKRVFIIRNSWGTKWGDQGYFYIPYDYMLNPDLTGDFWTVIKVQDQSEDQTESDSDTEPNDLSSIPEGVSEMVNTFEVPDRTPLVDLEAGFVDAPDIDDELEFPPAIIWENSQMD
jgi:C1A family cysteine protease